MSGQEISGLTEREKYRFWEYVAKTDGGCWLWAGAKNDGYGVFSLTRLRRGPFSAHRVAWAIEHGNTPSNLVVMHKCNNKTCVNPDHLKVGTQRENFRDAVRDGLLRRRAVCPSCGRGFLAERGATKWCRRCRPAAYTRSKRRTAVLKAQRKKQARLRDLREHAEQLERAVAIGRAGIEGLVGIRNADMFIRNFGLFGESPTTLTRLGEMYGMSRERARQVVTRTCERLGLQPHTATSRRKAGL